MSKNGRASISIHDLLDINIDQRGPILKQVQEAFGDVAGEAYQARTRGHSMSSERPQIDVSFNSSMNQEGLREMAPHFFGRQWAAFDANYRTRISGHGGNEIVLETSSAPIEWLIWFIQAMLIQSRATFVHCAGVARDSGAVLFPSWGGVGKTAIAKVFVSDDGWKLLGDDLVILTESGQCLGFPKPMVLYPYHRSVFPDLFEGGEGPIAPASANRLLTRAAVAVKPALRTMPSVLNWMRQHNPQSVRIAPSKVFGAQSLSVASTLQSITWIDRDASITEPRIEPADRLLVSRIAGSTMSEFDRRCVGLTPILCGLGIVSFEEFYGEWINILDRGLAHAEKWMIFLPVTLPVAEVPQVLQRLLRSVGQDLEAAPCV